MSWGYMGDSSDNNRAVRQSSYMGDPHTAEGATETALSQAARQAVPDPGLHMDGQYDMTPSTERQAAPNPDMPGETQGLGDDSGQGFFGSTAPVKYPFPMSSASGTRFATRVPD